MEKMSYEEAFKKLGEIVDKVENENIPMSEVMEYLETGKELISICYSELDKAKGKLTEVKEFLGKLDEE